jgi:6-pyruvoyltetrahydropterin/6-carboxytetrahydropterin synthase
MSELTPYQGWVVKWSSHHFYRNPKWDDKKNEEVFGLCSNQEGHGHDYKLEVCFKSENADSIRIKSTLVKLKKKLDHKSLNQLPELQGQIPTTENLADWIFQYLKKETGVSQIRMRLWETDGIWVDLKTL